jgi:beta-lactamase superfamily II metal-dependent hydrolase
MDVLNQAKLNQVLIGLGFMIWNLWLNLDRNSKLEVVFLDVGQGDASLIITPLNQKILIDTGATYIASQKISKYTGLANHTLDATLLSHPDLDHVGGTQFILDSTRVKNLVSRIRSDLDGFGISSETQKGYINSNMKILWNNSEATNLELSIETLNPSEKVIKTEDISSNDNHYSLVNRLIYGNFEFIFMADADSEVERMLVAQGKFENDKFVKILKVGHHGSKTSSSEIFLKKLKPDYCLISVGLNNKYGHPDEEVLIRLRKYCKNIYRTDEDGDIRFQTDGKILNVYSSK